MMEDYLEGVRYGVVEQGGFVRYMTSLTREQRSCMRAVERANLVAFNAMGSERYLGLVRQNAATLGGENTDEGAGGDELSEEELAEVDPHVQDRQTLDDLLVMLRRELSNMMAREEWHQSSVCQSLILEVLDAIRGGATEEARLYIKQRCHQVFGLNDPQKRQRRECS